MGLLSFKNSPVISPNSGAVASAAIDAAVIYFTLQICGIGMEDFAIVPKGPLLAFLLVQNGGYLVAFTAGGQTLGKMVAGIRVVSTDDDGDLDVGRALLRTFVATHQENLISPAFDNVHSVPVQAA